MVLTDIMIQTVWSKARIVEGFDKEHFRKDALWRLDSAV